jgi:hypothetical protein
MALLEWKAEPIHRDIAVLLEALSPSEAAKQFASIAATHIADAKRINRVALGRDPAFTTYVDGQAGASLESVKFPTGVIFTEFELVTDILIFIAGMLEKFSPVGRGKDRRPGHPGLYKRSHVLFADNIEIDLTTPALVPQILSADEYVFVNTLPYARKIERGYSRQRPEGVYQSVADIARRRYSKVARIEYSFRSIHGGERNPAIVIRTG